MKEGMKILCVPPSMAGAVVAKCGANVARGLSVAPELDPGEVLADLAAGTSLLWIVLDAKNDLFATVMTEIIEDDGGAVSIFALAGRELHAWAAPLLEKLALFAREEGCSKVRFAGRRAWARVFPNVDIVGEYQGQMIFERAA